MSTAGARIKQARHRMKLSQRELAEQVGVSHTTISNYERGEKKPGSEVLMNIADALGVDLSFFLRAHRVVEIAPAYRKLASLNKGDERQLIERIRDWLERYLETEEIVNPAPKAFEMPTGFPYPVTSVGEAEAAATLLRETWDLGTDPIEDVTALLEDHGIRVGRVDADNGFDACTFRADINGGIPVVVTRTGLPGDRQRFNLAHELGHLLLDIEDDLDEETVCHRFAGALLAPEPAVRDTVGDAERRNITLDELHVLKHKFGLSMQAFFFRLRDVGVISEYEAKRAHREFRKRGLHRKEPGDPVPPEQPERFHLLVLRAYGEGLIGEKRARELYDGPIAELESQLEPVA